MEEIKEKINSLFSVAEKEYKKKLKRPVIHISNKPVAKKQPNTLYLTNKELNSEKKDRIINRKTVSLICSQLFKDAKPHERRILKLKIGIKSNLRNPEKYKDWPWFKKDAEIAREKGLTRERIGQIRESLFV